MKVDKKVIVLVILFLLSYVFLLRPQFARRNRIRTELGKREQILRDCFSRKGELPTEDTLNRLKKSNDRLKKDYKSLSGELFQQSISRDTLPFEKEKWPLYFRKVLQVTTAELVAEAQKRNARIPSSFGFGSGIPSEEEVIELLKRLGFVRKFVLLALDSGVSEVALFQFLEEDSGKAKEPSGRINEEQALEGAGRASKQKKETVGVRGKGEVKADFIEECTFTVKLTCNTESLYRLLYTFQKDYSFFLIKNIQVKRDESRLTVDLLLSALYERKPLSEDTEPGSKKKKSSPVL